MLHDKKKIIKIQANPTQKIDSFFLNQKKKLNLYSFFPIFKLFEV